jgi:hypothetical protein
LGFSRSILQILLNHVAETNAFVGQKNFDIIEIHGATTKIIDAQQAKLHNIFKNTKLKLLKTNAAIWFNKICIIKQLKPNYINIKNNGRIVHLLVRKTLKKLNVVGLSD